MQSKCDLLFARTKKLFPPMMYNTFWEHENNCTHMNIGHTLNTMLMIFLYIWIMLWKTRIILKRKSKILRINFLHTIFTQEIEKIAISKFISENSGGISDSQFLLNAFQISSLIVTRQSQRKMGLVSPKLAKVLFIVFSLCSI